LKPEVISGAGDAADELQRNQLDRLLKPDRVLPLNVRQLPTASYQAGDSSQYHKNPAPVGSGDRSVATAYYRLRDWSRWLDENLDLVTGAFDKLVNFIVGGGITIEPTVRDRKGRLLPKVNEQIRRAIVDESYPDCWSRDCNVTGEYTRGEQERIACRSWLRDGEILGRKVPRQIAPGRIPYQVQLIEADYLAFEMLKPLRDGTAIIHGVEKDEWGRPIAYHIYHQNPVIVSDFRWATGLDTTPVSAEEISHLKFIRRANQTRGVPIDHSTILRLDDVAEYEDAHRAGARAAAQLLGWIKRSADTFGLSGDGSPYSATDDKRKWDLEDATFLSDLLPGEDAGFYKPETPNPDATPFLDDQLRRAASGFGLGYSTFAGKYDKAFSAARQEQSENWPNIEQLRGQFISDFVRPVEYEPALRAAILLGRVRIPREADPDTILTADISGPPRPTIDDLKQVQADREMKDARFDSRVGRIRERGRDPTRVDAEIENDPLAAQPASAAAPNPPPPNGPAPDQPSTQ